MSRHYHNFFKIIICFSLLWAFFGVAPQPTFAASDHSLLEKELENYILEHEQDMAGLAAIVIDQDDVISSMKGYANIEEQVPVDQDTVFEWGSVSKILIWISVLQLAEAGKLDTDADIRSYLPSDFYTKTAFEEPVTLHHLMHHSAGFDDSYTDLMIHRPSSKPSLRDVLETADVQQVFSPGEVVAYSNYGSSLAAFIVEQVSGQDYRAYVRQHIFEPLHMTKTAIDPEQDDQPWVKEQRRKVQGYSGERKRIEPNLYAIPLFPAGSVMGTPADLQKLLQALLDKDGGSLFRDEETMDLLFEPTLFYPGTDIPRMANGLISLPSKSGHVYGHGGNTKAFSSSFYVNRKDRRGVLVLANMENESAFTAGIPELIFGKYTHARSHKELEASSKWEGIYEPARLPRHGFSKMYGLFLRSHTKPSGTHDLQINDFHYAQLEPGVYQTKTGPSNYSLDVYSEQPQVGKVLSNTFSDLLYVPLYQHVLEWIGLIIGLLALLFSFLYVAVTLFTRIRSKKKLHTFILTQHVLNLLLFANILWIVYQTAAMVSYSFLQPFLMFNLLYLLLVLVNSGMIVRTAKRTGLPKAAWVLTIISAIILSGNVLYWEFYF